MNTNLIAVIIRVTLMVDYMPNITANVDTLLKMRPVQSGDLKSSEFLGFKKGQSLIVSGIDPKLPNGHVRVTLGLPGWKVGYVYAPHWDFEGVKSLGFVSSQKETTGIIRKIVSSKKLYQLQPDSQTCQSACIAMITGGDIWAIREALTDSGVAGDPYNMGNYIKPRVKEYKFYPDASLNQVRRLLDDDYQLITHGFFTGSGHVVKISGYEARNLGIDFIVDDPWNEFHGKGWSYAPWDKSGDDVRYSAHLMYAACVGSYSVSQAAEIYRKGVLDSANENMWIHAIKN
ncbi:MAG: hypothetical protein ACRDBG_09830 [Waterburya sp.]